jgi:predicted nucleotidyltransferase
MRASDNWKKNLGRQCECINEARKCSKLMRDKLLKCLSRVDNAVSSWDEVGVVVFGSLARDEMTPKSDLDWTLLIDGRSDPTHFLLARKIASALREANLAKAPGPTGLFGNMAFSHEILHHIGGQADSNINTTRRILLLLESRSIGSDIVRGRVINNILHRYISEDPSATRHPPRFLLNDVVRFWRTMAVDFVSKVRDRDGRGAALRNIKLRMSRKLIFVTGMLMDFSCELDLPKQDREKNPLCLVRHLREQVDMSPLDLLARYLTRYSNQKTAQSIFDAYEGYLTLITNEAVRSKLDELDLERAEKDPDFIKLKEIGGKFQQGLTAFFFEESKKIAKLTKQYGVF